ncbi:MAG: galactose oxidase [Tannerellaceae bacterium]|nr:galactose oxidase [Tannerellaceae bacterium]
MIQKRLLVFFIAILPFVVTSCHDDDDDLIGLWTRVGDFSGVARSGASSFTISNSSESYGYVMGGYIKNKPDSTLWRYTMSTGDWHQLKAPFGGVKRTNAVAVYCEANGKAYYGLGNNNERKTFDREGNYIDLDNDGELKDWWAFDPAANNGDGAWERKADFAGTARYNSIAFCIGTKIYVGLGSDDEQGLVNDIYEYDVTTDRWNTTSFTFPGGKSEGASVFVIDDIAYIVGGLENSLYAERFFSFDPSKADPWTRLRDIYDSSDEDYDDEYTSIRRAYGVTFVIDGCGYLACGYNGGLVSDTWKYIPETDLWEKVAKFKGSARREAVSFSTGVKQGAFVLTGNSGTTYFDDVWNFDPYVYDDDDY